MILATYTVKLEQQKQKSTSVKTKCRKCNLIPKGFLSKKRISTRKSNQMEERCAKIRMREVLNSMHAKLFLLELDTKTAHMKERYRLEPQLLKKTQDREYFKRMKTLNKKFMKMLSLRKSKISIPLVKDAVINLSSKTQPMMKQMS